MKVQAVATDPHWQFDGTPTLSLSHSLVACLDEYEFGIYEYDMTTEFTTSHM